MTGHLAEDVIGLPADFLAAEGDRPAAYADNLAELHRDGHWRGESWVRRASGESFPVALNLSVLRDARGRATRYVALCSDISERKSREIALRESEKRFRDIMEFAPIGMVIVGLDGRLLKVNQALCDILGYARDELEGTSFELITHPEDLAQDLGAWRQLLDGQLPVLRGEKRYLHRDGRIVWVQRAAVLRRPGRGCHRAQAGSRPDSRTGLLRHAYRPA
jgi:PAS domain S-box-containing protein